MTSVLNTVSKYSVGLYFLLLPLFVLPVTYDLVDINKSIFIAFFACFWLVLIAVKNFTKPSLKLTASYLFLPTVLLISSYLISSVFSVSTSYTLWGFYGFLSNSLPLVILILMLPLLISSVVESKKNLAPTWLFLSVGLFTVLLFSLISFFQIIPQGSIFAYLVTIFVNTAGGFVVLKYILMLSGFIASVGFLASGNSLLKQVFYIVYLLITLILAILVMSIPYTVVILLLSAIPFAIFRKNLDRAKTVTLGAALLVFFTVAAFNYVPSLKASARLNQKVPKEVNLSFQNSWVVSNNVIGLKAAFGSGPSTFVWDYSQFKPQRINNTDLWDTLFVKPSSFYLLVLAEVGLVGFLALLFYVFKLSINGFRAFMTVSKKGNENNIYILSLYLVLLMFLVFFFTTPGNAFILGMFFGLIGLVLAYEKSEGLNKVTDVNISLSGKTKSSGYTSSLLSGTKTFSYMPKIFTGFVIVFIAFYAWFLGRVYIADVVFASVYNKPETLLDLRANYQKAAQIHPRNDFYQRSIVQVNTEIARILLNPENADTMSDEEKKQNINSVQTLLNESSIRSDLITSQTDLGINPKNWETRGLLFQRGIGLVNNAEVTALQTYNTAAEIDKNNPRLPASIGSVYFASENYPQAAQYFERAVLLKPDYAAARYNLAQAYQKQGNNTVALAVARTIIPLIDQESADYESLMKYINDLSKIVNEEKAAAKEPEKISVDDGTKPTTQPGLTEAGQPPITSSQRGTQTPPKPVVAPGAEESVNANPETGLPALPGQEPAASGEGAVEQPAP
jgi:tetratricopeptide (TPR) repeat protein